MLNTINNVKCLATIGWMVEKVLRANLVKRLALFILRLGDYTHRRVFDL
jgi:hypothetical protein